MKPDFLLTHPRHVDYMWFRYNMDWIKQYANKIFMAITPGEPSIMNFIQGTKEYKDVVWVKPPLSNGTEDWRNLAVRDMVINFSKSPYLLFLEQDFLMREELLREIIHLTEIEFAYDWIYYKEGERIHPAFSLVRREHALKTSLNFAAAPPDHDHFGLFHKELLSMNLFKADLREIGFQGAYDYYHIASLTQNFHVFKQGEQFYRPDEFLAYNALALELPILKEPTFDALCQQIREKFGTGSLHGTVRKFFPREREYKDMNPASYRVTELIEKKHEHTR